MTKVYSKQLSGSRAKSAFTTKIKMIDVLHESSKAEPSGLIQFVISDEHGKRKQFENIAIALPVGEDREELVLSNTTQFKKSSKVFNIYLNQRLGKKLVETKEPLDFNSKMELVEVAQDGVVAHAIPKLAELLQIPVKKAVELFNMSDRTLRKYIKGNALLNTDASEKVLKMFSLFLYGCEIFGGSVNFVKWINRPSFGLRGKVPINLLSSSDGIDLVYDELTRLEFGDIA